MATAERDNAVSSIPHRATVIEQSVIDALAASPPSPAAYDAAVATLLSLVASCVPGYDCVPLTAVHTRVISGGITNALLCVYPAPSSPPAAPHVLVRIFGAKTELLIDREKDLAAYAYLAAAGYAPRLFATFTNGRVEQFLHGIRPLQPSEMGSPPMLLAIGAELGRFHAYPGPPRVAAAVASGSAALWMKLHTWLRMAVELVPAICREDGVKSAAMRCIHLPAAFAFLTTYEAHMSRRRVDLTSAAAAAPQDALLNGAAFMHRVRFTHCDLLSGNILIDDSQRVRFIDYEYADASLTGFDIANHWCEHAGFDFNFTRDAPSIASQEVFMHSYVTACVTSGETACGVDRFAKDDVALAAFVRAAATEARAFILASHLWWGLWSSVQAAVSALDFPFHTYAVTRLSACDAHKSLWLRDGVSAVTESCATIEGCEKLCEGVVAAAP